MRFASPTTQDQLHGTVDNDVVGSQSAGPSPSALSALSSDLFTSMLKMAAENSKLLHQKIEELANENARLREELSAVRHSEAPEKNSTFRNDDSSIFACFPRLPVELRTRIWKLIAHQPRIVEVRRVALKPTLSHPGMETFGKEFRICDNGPPPVLHVNQESRKEAKKYYHLNAINYTQYQTYFNAEADSLYLTFVPDSRCGLMEKWTEYMDGNWKDKIKRIAIRSSTFNNLEDDDYDYNRIEETVGRFYELGVEEILFVDEACARDHYNGDVWSSRGQNEDLELMTLRYNDVINSRVTEDEHEIELLTVDHFLDVMRGIIKDAFKDAKDLVYISRRWKGKGGEFVPKLRMARLGFRQSVKKDEMSQKVGRRIYVI